MTEARITEAEAEDLLRDTLRREMDKSGEPDDARLIRREPYFYKEYVAFPEPNALSIAIEKTESQIQPYVADVTYPKVRYATPYRRKRDEARGDTEFVRETGEETATYEMRAGKWKRVSSMFVVEKSERQEEGRWVAIEKGEAENPLTQTPEEGGWFRKMWQKVGL